MWTRRNVKITSNEESLTEKVFISIDYFWSAMKWRGFFFSHLCWINDKWSLICSISSSPYRSILTMRKPLIFSSVLIDDYSPFIHMKRQKRCADPIFISPQWIKSTTRQKTFAQMSLVNIIQIHFSRDPLNSSVVLPLKNFACMMNDWFCLLSYFNMLFLSVCDKDFSHLTSVLI